MCGVQEAETVLCKYKSYRNGHYFVGKDTKEIRYALKGWGATANHLAHLVGIQIRRHAPPSKPDETVCN